jgi:hypothetical protein
MNNLEEIKQLLTQQHIELVDVVAVVYVLKPADLICNFIFAPNNVLLCSLQMPNTGRNLAKLMADLAEYDIKVRRAPIQPSGTPLLTLDAFRLRLVDRLVNKQ